MNIVKLEDIRKEIDKLSEKYFGDFSNMSTITKRRKVRAKINKREKARAKAEQRSNNETIKLQRKIKKEKDRNHIPKRVRESSLQDE